MPTPTWERLPQARRIAVREAAEAEFAARGYGHASLNTICREAGISKGSLFQYFPDKADLYAHLADLASQRIRAAMQVEATRLDWEHDFRGSLDGLLEAWVRYFYDHPRDLGMTAATNLEPDSLARSAVRATVDAHYIEVLEPLLEVGAATGQLPEGTDHRALLAMLLVLLPHLALAPHVSGLDPLMEMAQGPDQAVAAARRMLALILS